MISFITWQKSLECFSFYCHMGPCNAKGSETLAEIPLSYLALRNLSSPACIPCLRHLFFQLCCLSCKTLGAAELRLFIAESRDCLIKAQANSPKRHIAQDSSRSSPKPRNKIIKGHFTGQSTEHCRTQGAAGGRGQPCPPCSLPQARHCMQNPGRSSPRAAAHPSLASSTRRVRSERAPPW